VIDKPFVVAPTRIRAFDNQIQDLQEDGMSRTWCPSCQSGNQRKFTSEVNIHFPGMKGIDIPTVWVFPEILVCMDCGEAQLIIPEAERKELEDRDYRDFIQAAAV